MERRSNTGRGGGGGGRVSLSLVGTTPPHNLDTLHRLVDVTTNTHTVYPPIKKEYTTLLPPLKSEGEEYSKAATITNIILLRGTSNNKKDVAVP